MTRSREPRPLAAAAAFPPAQWEGEEEAGARWEPVAASAAPKRPAPQLLPLDALLDYALSALAHEVKRRGLAEMPVPDIEQEVSKYMTQCVFTASGGSVGGLSSLIRDGPVTLRQEPGGALLVQAAAGLSHLRLHFRHYKASAGPLSTSGTIEAVVKPAILRVQLELARPRRLTLRSLRVGQLGPLQMDVTGLGPMRSILLPLLEGWLDRRMRNALVDLARERLQNELQRLSKL